MSVNSNKQQDGKEGAGRDKMALSKSNYILMLIGFVIIAVGFVLMVGGASASPEEFNYEMFSFRRITLAPIVVLAGFAFEVYAIMKKDKTRK